MELFTHYYLAKDSYTGQDILDSAQDYPVIVIRFADGHYVVIDKTKLKNILSIWHALQTPLVELPENVFLSSLVTSVEASDSRLTDIGHVNRLFGEQEYLVVTRDSHIIGLLVKSVQVRGLEKGALVGEEPGELFINTDLEGYDRTKPLELNKRYLLAIWIAQSRQGESVGYTGVFQTGEEEITLSVRLESDDFSLEPKDASGLTQRTIRLQRKGSLEKATFDIQPLHPGEGFIRAYFFKGLQFIQVIQVRLFTGKLFDVEASGLSLEASFQPERRRDLSLIITETDGGFHLVMAGAVAATAFLPISANYLAQLLTDVREELKSIVHFEADGQTVYQQAIDIPQAVADDSFKKLAFAGYKLFRKLFYGPEMDSQVKQLGDSLSQMAQAGDLNIQIYSQHEPSG